VLEHGWVVTNVLGVVVLLSIFVMTHVVAALMSFRMISLVPHHVPALLGFHGANRVDIDQFSKDAALVGVGGTLLKIDEGLTGAIQTASQSRIEGSGVAPRLSRPGGAQGAPGDGPSSGGPSGGMDSTLRATTDFSPPSDEEA
jgi:hypothetical protein